MTYQPSPVMRLAINAAKRQLGNLSLHQPAVKAVVAAFERGECPAGGDKVMAKIILNKEIEHWQNGLFVSVKVGGFKKRKYVREADPSKAKALQRVLSRIEGV